VGRSPGALAGWEPWTGRGLEHLALREGPRGVIAEGLVLGGPRRRPFGLRYVVRCDPRWRTTALEVRLAGGAGAATPFTNTLPIRRLALAVGSASDVLVVLVEVPGLRVSPKVQRYTRLGRNRYRFETADGRFRRDLRVDRRGLVVTYPGLFRRVP
jgi:hypothetical protein